MSLAERVGPYRQPNIADNYENAIIRNMLNAHLTTPTVLSTTDIICNMIKAHKFTHPSWSADLSEIMYELIYLFGLKKYRSGFKSLADL